MITVQIERNEKRHIHSFTMSGHAEAGPYGQDIVCAGASAVSFGAINAIAELCQVEPHIDLEGDGGFLRCTVPDGLDVQTYEKVQLLLEGMVVALRSIEAEYSKHITIQNQGR
ncbi:ribosomal-processing cysteine protease Prp [Alkalihalobacterium chitinilyticum]|uniref:Ribosomal processing cysteine protease Prp n=1 Tax=Alkalihalobacterium chitinilyticum TaxID=2980103 RepID=A0ABT5VAJ3_9BACI|nr:ribosomal-processing cysteine protease Prp [Alkalihalobacterium chitinilyticum]MDE5412460.1 ribosomal-processing cysteine protease Prp [Alkalihalobacterium chitinilyticum]